MKHIKSPTPDWLKDGVVEEGGVSLSKVIVTAFLVIITLALHYWASTGINPFLFLI